MARLISLNARTASDAEYSDEIEVVLMRFYHPDLEAPVLLSTDPGKRISDDPLMYATRSRWQSTTPDDYLFVLASALLPDDLPETVGTAQIVLELLDYRMVEPLRSITKREGTADLAVVLASDPDTPEIEYRGLVLMGARGDASRLTLTLGPEDDEQEPHCRLRMTRLVTPGLWP